VRRRKRGIHFRKQCRCSSKHSLRNFRR